MRTAKNGFRMHFHFSKVKIKVNAISQRALSWGKSGQGDFASINE